MKRTLLLFVLPLLLCACGPSDAEIQRMENNLKAVAQADSARREQLRIHNEKIEVGKTSKRIWLGNTLNDIKEQIRSANDELEEINRFQFGRPIEKKNQQLAVQRKRIANLESLESGLEREIAQTHLFQNFEFQLTPKGVVQHMFECAKKRNFSTYRHLPDPYGECKNKIWRMSLMDIYPSEDKESFISEFSNARIMGEPVIKGDIAELEVAVGPQSNQLEKIRLVKRMNYWYLM
jgi:TolA-binding protein